MLGVVIRVASISTLISVVVLVIISVSIVNITLSIVCFYRPVK